MARQTANRHSLQIIIIIIIIMMSMRQEKNIMGREMVVQERTMVLPVAALTSCARIRCVDGASFHFHLLEWEWACAMEYACFLTGSGVVAAEAREYAYADLGQLP